MSYFVNGEQIYLTEAIGMILCFAAVACIAIRAKDEENLEIVDTTIGDVEYPDNYEYQVSLAEQ